MVSVIVPAAVNGKVESIKKKFGNRFPDIEIASALKINNMDVEQSTEFLREFEPFVEVKRKGRGRNKKMVPENQVQQQQEAVAQMYPLAHLSHQPEVQVDKAQVKVIHVSSDGIQTRAEQNKMVGEEI